MGNGIMSNGEPIAMRLLSTSTQWQLMSYVRVYVKGMKAKLSTKIGRADGGILLTVPQPVQEGPWLEWRLEAWNRIVLFCFVEVLVSLIWQAQAWFDCRLENLSAICAMDYCSVNIKVHGHFRLCTHVNPRGARNRDDVLNHDSNSDSVF